VLLVSSLFKLPYRVLRCAASAGATVFVLGVPQARLLAASRFCKAFIASTSVIDGAFNPALAREINDVVAHYSIDLVAAADASATRSLIEIRDLVDARCFPMPDIPEFDLLNDKWRFAQLCDELEILHPPSRLFERPDQIAQELRTGGLRLPLFIKPTNLDGGLGCHKVASAKALPQRLRYSPILVQEFIPGADAAGNIFCRQGRVEAFIAHKYIDGVYTMYHDEEVYRSARRIAERLGLTGMFNFDLRVAGDGRAYFLECNPRVFFKMGMAMVAGVNFFGLGMAPGREAPLLLEGPVSVRFLRAFLETAATPWRLRTVSPAALDFLLQDPWPWTREKLGLDGEAPAQIAQG
jgi:predicted ATP-grasp superfamily ATP-dependent carboligase